MNNKLAWLIRFLPWIASLCYSKNTTTESSDILPPFMFHEIYQVAKRYGFNRSIIIDRPTFAMIRNKADDEDVSKGSTMNACFFTGILYLFGNVPPYYRIDVKEALIWLQKASYQGHEGARCALGVLHYYGSKDVGKDRKMAMRWFYRAVQDSASRQASYLLARCLYEGMNFEDIGVDGSSLGSILSTRMNDKRIRSKSLTESARLMIFAAKRSRQDDQDLIPEALHYLGMMCEYGLIDVDELISGGIIQTENTNQFKLAADLYNQATHFGYAESMYHLALMYAYGRGVPLNYAKAADLLRRAALDHYHAASMRYLAIFCIKGYGAPQNEIDYDMAQYWFRQCIQWSENHAETFHSLKKLCLTELKEITDLLLKAENFKNNLLVNLTRDVKNDKNIPNYY